MNHPSNQEITRIIQAHYRRLRPVALDLSEADVIHYALRHLAGSLSQVDDQVAEQLATHQDRAATAAPPTRTSRGEEREQRYQDFFNGLINKLRARGFPCRRKALRRHYYEMSAGHGLPAQFAYSCSFNAGSKARVELYLSGTAQFNDRLYQHLYRDHVDIDAEFGEALDWQELRGRKACRIATQQCNGHIDDSAEKLADLQDWMAGKLEGLDRVLGPRLDKFQL